MTGAGFACACFLLFAAAQQLRWQMADDGGITWKVKQGESHQDHIEMSGRQLSAIIHYGQAPTGQLILKRRLVFPMLRTIPNNTHASLTQVFEQNIIAPAMITLCTASFR